jgi:serine/threonine-protein kinase
MNELNVELNCRENIDGQSSVAKDKELNPEIVSTLVPHFLFCEPLGKGWSSDKKYIVETRKREKQLLRISNAPKMERKLREFQTMKFCYDLGLKVQNPLKFVVDNENNIIYMLLSWLEGEDLEVVLPDLTKPEQYEIGIKAGKLLNRIHSLFVPENLDNWYARFLNKMRDMLSEYDERKELNSEAGNLAKEYLTNNQEVLSKRSQTIIHGDFHPRNLILLPDNDIGVIDFNVKKGWYGDPWYEFGLIAWERLAYHTFYKGQFDGYFNGKPPNDFFRTMAFYSAYAVLKATLDPSRRIAMDDEHDIIDSVLEWYNNFEQIVPGWYLAAQE